MVERQVEEAYRARVRGCLLGGAIGDALGGPVEFRDGRSIVAEHPDGVRTFLAGGNNWPPGTVTDDTQMTLFAVEGLIRAGVRTDRGLGLTVAVTQHAFDRWLDTQLLPGPSGERDGWLQGEQWLYVRRAPGNTCLTALTEARKGSDRIAQFGAQAVNDSKGCGGVMRSAPFGLLPYEGNGEWVFDAAAESAGYTHGHPTGKLASGALALLVHLIVQGADLEGALDATLELLGGKEQHEETSAALIRARELATGARPGTGPVPGTVPGTGSVPGTVPGTGSAAGTVPGTGSAAGTVPGTGSAAGTVPGTGSAAGTVPAPGPATVELLGGGWVAEEALAIGVYAALAYRAPEQFLDALALSVTHSGDSDSTGAICGNILGALHGETALPAELVFAVEGRGVILELADDLVLEYTRRDRLHGDYGPETTWRNRYPGW